MHSLLVDSFDLLTDKRRIISPDLQCLWFHDDSHEGCRLTQLSAEGDLNHVSSLALLCHSDNSTSGCQPRVSSAWSISLTLCWRLYSGYSWGHLVVPYTKELISRPFLDENSIWRLFWDRVDPWPAAGCFFPALCHFCIGCHWFAKPQGAGKVFGKVDWSPKR